MSWLAKVEFFLVSELLVHEDGFPVVEQTHAHTHARTHARARVHARAHTHI